MYAISYNLEELHQAVFNVTVNLFLVPVCSHFCAYFMLASSIGCYLIYNACHTLSYKKNLNFEFMFQVCLHILILGKLITT